MSLLIVGSAAYDSIKTPFGKVDRALGGSAVYFSLAASYFSKPSVVAVVGTDFRAGDKKLLAGHADISGLKTENGKTFAWGGEYNFDLNDRKTLFTHLNVFENFKPTVSEKHKNSDFVFLGNIHPKLQLDVLKQIRKPKFVGLDTMNYWMSSAPKDLAKVLKLVDVFIINDSEARQLSGQHNLLKAAKKILGMMNPRRRPSAGGEGRLLKVLIIKRGEYGLIMFNQKSIFNLPGYPLEDVVDPTGAGDSFAGGFMGYLAKTKNLNFDNLKQACVYGSVAASFCVQRMGTSGLRGIKANEVKKRCRQFKNLTDFKIV